MNAKLQVIEGRGSANLLTNDLGLAHVMAEALDQSDEAIALVRRSIADFEAAHAADRDGLFATRVSTAYYTMAVLQAEAGRWPRWPCKLRQPLVAGRRKDRQTYIDLERCGA